MSSVREHAEKARLHGAAVAYEVASGDGLSPRQFAWFLGHLRRIESTWKLPIRERHRWTVIMLKAGVPDREIREALQISQPTLWRFKCKMTDPTTPKPSVHTEVGSEPRFTTGENHSNSGNRPDGSDPAISSCEDRTERPVTAETLPLLTLPRRSRPAGMPSHLCGLCPRKHFNYATARAVEINESGPGTTRREFERKIGTKGATLGGES